jgi:hypothetical protein
MRRQLLYLWGLALTCLAFDISGLIYAVLNPVANEQSPLIFPFTLAGFFVAWMILTNFVMQRGFAQGAPMKAARLGWYWAVIGGVSFAVVGWHSLTHFSTQLLAGHITLYSMLFLFACWGISCYVQYVELKKLHNAKGSSHVDD